MLDTKPYNKSPYEDLKHIHVPWLEAMRNIVKDRITEVEKLLVADAERNGVPGLANEDEMYARFLDNKECGMDFANLEVFKYFALRFRIKMYYEMIGKWRFTKRDVEMYNYYLNDFSCGRSAYSRSFMCYESDRTVLNLNGFMSSSKWTSLDRELDGSEEFTLMYSVGDDLYRTTYFNLFTEKSHVWNLLVNKVKGLAVDGSKSNYLSDLNYFDSGNFYDTTHGGLRPYSEMHLLDSHDIPDVSELRRKRGLNVKKKFYVNNKEYVKAYRKDYRETHQEQVKERQRKNYEAHRERYCEQKRQYNKDNKDVIAARRKEYNATHKEENSARHKKYREAHKEELAKKDKAYRQANKEELARKKKIYIENNREAVVARRHKYYVNHKDELSIKRKANYEANREAILAQKKEYYAANIEKCRAKCKKYHESHKEELSVKRKAYVENNRAKVAETNKRYYESHKEELAQKNKAYYEQHKEVLSKKNKAWREANKERCLQNNRDYYNQMTADGYRYRKDPADGKRKWIYVGTELNKGVDNA